MAPLRFALLPSTLLVLALCWSANANTTPTPLPPGFVTRYVTPMANLSLDKLVGRWYVAEVAPLSVPPHIKAHLCLLYDFRYDENDTLVVEPIAFLDGVRDSPFYTCPVSANGVWDKIWNGELTHSMAVVHVDDRFLAVAACNANSEKQCGALLAVRDVADAGRRDELEGVRRRVEGAVVEVADSGFWSLIEPCRSVATAATHLSGQNVASDPVTE